MATQAAASVAAAGKALDEQLRSTYSGKQLDLTTQELIDLMRNVSPGQIANFRRHVMKMSVDKMTAAQFSIYEYQGFDPKKIVLKFLAIAQHLKIKTDDLISDIMHIIAINLYMGNIANSKKLERRTSEAKQKLSELVAKYGLKLGSTGTGLQPETITVPRTSAAFPVLSTRMATLLPTTNTMGMPFKSYNLPNCMKITSFASFLSHNIDQATRDFLMKSVLAYSSDQTTVFSIDQKTRKPTVDPISAYNRQLTYVQASMSSTVPEEWEKGTMLEEFKIIDAYTTLEPIVANLHKITGMNDSVVSETDYKKHLQAFYDMCNKDKVQRLKEENLILASERAAKTSKPAPAPPVVPVSPQTTTQGVPVQTPTTSAADDLLGLHATVSEGSADDDDLYNV